MYPASFIVEEDDMVYTEERLKRALEVFRASKPYRKRRSLPGNNLENFLESRSKQYKTRSTKSSLAVRTTITGIWNDKDESGDYTPRRKKAVTKTQKLSQNTSKRKPNDASGRDENKGAKRNKISYTSGRQKGLSLKVAFKFKSDAAKAKFAELFPVTTSNTGLHSEGHYTGGDVINDGDENNGRLLLRNEGPLFPSLEAPAALSSDSPAQSLGDFGAKSQYTRPTDSAVGPKPTQQRLPTACQSDPIIIDDSEDSKTDNGDLVDGTGLCGLAGGTKTIRTNWVHPVDYRCKPEACNFCQDFRYSIFGCGAVNIEVIQIEPGVFEETGGGHREMGMAPTKICLNCSLERIAIAKCSRHEILRIDGCLEDDFDYPSYLNQIESSPYPEHPTCSVCIKPAFFACATRQKEDPCGLPVMGGDHNGCGLLLCGDCAEVVANYGLNMKLLESNGKNSKVLRADRDFLLPGSDLWQAWRN